MCAKALNPTLLNKVFKEMKKSVQSSEEENQYMGYFGDMLTEKYSENVTERGNIGIAKMLYESMKRN